MVGQRGFWDEQQRVTKLQDTKPVLKRLADSIPWESFWDYPDSVDRRQGSTGVSVRVLMDACS